jgi:hypothetical protein
MIEKNQSVNVNDLSSEHETIVLGTPQEYGLEITKQSMKR